MENKGLAGKSAALIGCGGLGCNIAVHLAGAGIGKLYICDFDTVEKSNLNRQFLYTPADEGKKKAPAAAERLTAYAPDTEFIPVDKKITKKSDLSFAAGCDAVISALDNACARKAVLRFCAENGIPLVDGAIDGFFGKAYLYVPGKCPCCACAGFDAEGGRPVNTGTTAGIIGAKEAELALMCLAKQGENECGYLFVYDAGEMTRLKINSSGQCKICGSEPKENQ